MKGMIQIKAGKYDLSHATSMNVHFSDDGAVITVCHRPTGVRCTGVIDEHGNVRRSISRQADHPAPTLDSPTSTTNPESPTAGREGSRIDVLDGSLLEAAKPKKGFKLIRFTLITTGKTARRRNRPYVIAGFSNGDVTHIAYRINGEKIDRQLCLEGEAYLFGTQIRKVERLSSVEWAEVTKLAENASFLIQGKLGFWRSVPNDELRSLMEERVFHVPIKAVAIAQPPVPPRTPMRPKTEARPSTDRPKFKTRHVSILNCEPASFDHVDGEPATAITIAHKDSIEPLTLGLNDTRKLVVNLLISLWTADDSFAKEVLSKFPLDNSGIHQWPKQE